MTSRTVPGRRAAIRILGHDQGRPAIAVLMACLTFFGAAVAALQSDASIESGRFGRAANEASMRQIGLDARAQVGSLRDNAAFRQWFAVLQEAAWAREPGPSSDPAEVRARADLATIDGNLADWIRERSRLLQPPYFDGATFLVDFNGFSADLGRASRLSTERAAAAGRSSDAWQRKANSYVTILTMLAVAVFFLGLAGTVAIRARGILIAAGGALGGAALAATLALAVSPVVGVPEVAIDALVDAQVAIERAGSGDAIYLTDATREVYRSAIRDAATAVALDPGNVSAHRTAASANLFFANARIFAPEGPSAETDDLLRAGIGAFEQATVLDPDDPSTWWDLGFARYLLGDLEGSIAATQEVIERAPAQYVPYVNRAVAEAAAGRLEAADRSVSEAIDVAASTNLASNGAFFGRVDADLTRLANLRPADAPWLITAQRRLREANVAIRVLGRGAADAAAPVLGTIGIRALHLEADGTFSPRTVIDKGATIPRTGVNGLRLTLPGDADLFERKLSVRIWANDRPDPGFDRELSGARDGQTIDLVDPYGRAGYELAPGTWHLEVYVDGATRAQLTFTIGEAAG